MPPIDKGYEKPEDFFDEKTRDLNIEIKPEPQVEAKIAPPADELATRIVKASAEPEALQKPALPEATVVAKPSAKITAKNQHNDKVQRTGKSFSVPGEELSLHKFKFKLNWRILIPLTLILISSALAFFYLKNTHTKVQNPELLNISRPTFELHPNYDSWESFSADIEALYSQAK